MYVFHSVRCRECQKFALDGKFRRKHFYPPAEQKNYIPACLRPMGNISAHLEPIHRWRRRTASARVFFQLYNNHMIYYISRVLKSQIYKTLHDVWRTDITVICICRACIMRILLKPLFFRIYNN